MQQAKIKYIVYNFQIEKNRVQHYHHGFSGNILAAVIILYANNRRHHPSDDPTDYLMPSGTIEINVVHGSDRTTHPAVHVFPNMYTTLLTLNNAGTHFAVKDGCIALYDKPYCRDLIVTSDCCRTDATSISCGEHLDKTVSSLNDCNYKPETLPICPTN